MNTYTFDFLTESQDFDHNETFVLESDMIQECSHRQKQIEQLKQQLESMTNKCAELNYDKNCLISDLNQSRENERQLKQQLESIEKENRGLKMMLNHVAGVEHVCEDLEVKLAEAVEVIHWYAMPSINHHAYHDIMGTNLNIKAEQFLAKYRGEK